MRSIRRTLIFDLFLLLVLTLGALCGLVYSTTSKSLREKQESAGKLLHREFEDERDESLLRQARIIADVTQSRVIGERFRQVDFGAMGMLLAGHGPFGYLRSPIWVMESSRNPSSMMLHLALSTEIAFDESILQRDPESNDPEYVQINSEWGNVWKSHGLGDHSLTFDSTRLRSDPRISWTHDNIALDDGRQARRVVLKTPMVRTQFQLPMGMPWMQAEAARGLLGSGVFAAVDPRRIVPRPPENKPMEPRIGETRTGEGPPSSRRLPPPPRDRSIAYRSPPIFYIQYVWPEDSNNPLLHDLVRKRDTRLAELESDRSRSLRELRLRLLNVGVMSLFLMLLGGWILVGIGLRPLHRLSQGVAKISPKDFLLPLDRKSLPKEVLPVVDRLDRTLGLLQRAFEREKQAAADMSHELRTPLAALMISVDVSLRKPRSGEQYKETLTEIRAIGRQMVQLVERMLMLARIDAESDRLAPRDTDIDDLLRGCVVVCRPLAQSQGLSIELHTDGPQQIRTDPDKLREVVMNLLHNSIEYNRPGGVVELRTGATPEGGTFIEVRDTGIGIPAELHEKIFERFYRADSSRQQTGVHAGLGLAIVREYVTWLGGTMTLESQPGRGSRFRVAIPTIDDSERPNAAA